jgi:N-acetylmuramoyl-L-alanine amidase
MLRELVILPLLGVVALVTRPDAVEVVKDLHEPVVALAGNDSTIPTDSCQGDLSDTVVIIDAGHGGQDPGAHAEIYGQEIWEAPYVTDVALRLEEAVECRGGAVEVTREGVDTISNDPANVILPLNREDEFVVNGRQVEAGLTGLRTRLRVIDGVIARHPGKRIVWMSVHFDSLGKAKADGVAFLVPRNLEDDPVTTELVRAFDEAHRIRTFTNRDGTETERPLVINEDHRHVRVLQNDENSLRWKYLIELGNFSDQDDRYRIRDPRVRAEYARLIATGIARGLDRAKS